MIKSTIPLFLLLSVLLSIPIALSANGDPIISYSSVMKTGNPIPRTIADIQILKENLYIQPFGRYTSVSVEYVLQNLSDKDYQDIDYGFPVDYSGAEVSYMTPDPISESVYEVGWNNRNIKEVSFWLNGESLAVQHSSEVVVAAHKYWDADWGEANSDSAYNAGSSRRWYYTRFSVPAHKTVGLKVSYLLYHPQFVSFYGWNFSCFSRYATTGRSTFTYDFTPACHWGNGTVRDFSVTIDMSRQMLEYGETILDAKGLDLECKGNIWYYHKSNFQLEKAKTLELNYYFNNQSPDYSEIAAQQLDKRCYRVTSSKSNLKNPVGNLTDSNLFTAWVPEGNGVGSSLVLSFQKPEQVTDIILYNGYHKSQSLWQQNSRIERVQLETIREDGKKDDVIDISFSEQTYKPEYNKPTVIPVTKLWDFVRETEAITKKTIAGVNSIKITILEITPGSQFQDLCISELMVLSL